jgi:hypothetical protein
VDIVRKVIKTFVHTYTVGAKSFEDMSINSSVYRCPNCDQTLSKIANVDMGRFKQDLNSHPVNRLDFKTVFGANARPKELERDLC